MQFKALFFATAISALTVTAPTKGSSISQSSNLQITVRSSHLYKANTKWSTVATDSTPFSIELALSTDSSNAKVLASNVAPSTNGFTVAAASLATGNYTVNLVATEVNNSGILAQSGWFLITASSSGATTTGAAVSGSTIAASAASSIAASTGSAAAAGASGTAATTGTTTAPVSNGGDRLVAGAMGLVMLGAML